MLALIIASALVGACDLGKKEMESASPTSATASKKTTAAPRATAASAAKKKSKAREFFEGKVPDGVKLTKGMVLGEDKAIVTVPGPWKGSRGGGGLMTMRPDATAAVFCTIFAPTKHYITAQAKRAPAMGKDFTLDPVSEVVMIDGKHKVAVLVGSGTAHLFGKPGGRLFWLSYKYESMYAGEKTDGYDTCVVALRADADAAAIDEAKGIMRAYLPPPGKKALELRPGKVE